MTLNTPFEALRRARQECDQRCFGYHAAWGLFRRTGLKGNPLWHIGFYRTALDKWTTAPESGLRVLVAGAADETALKALDQLLDKDRPDVHLIDACPTPLHLARGHAYWTGMLLDARQDHAPELTTCNGPFDLIITDGLLSLLSSPEERAATVRRFAELLSDDGLLLYTARIAGRKGVLEYDRLGRYAMAAVALATGPGALPQRLRHARSLRRRRSRPAPFTNASELASCFTHEFADVRTHTRQAPHTLPLALAPSVRAGEGSTSVGIAAVRPKPGSRR